MKAIPERMKEIEELEREGRALIYEANRPLFRGFGHEIFLGVFGALVSPVLLLRFFEESGWVETLALAASGFVAFFFLTRHATAYASKKRYHLGLRLLWMARMERQLLGPGAGVDEEPADRPE